MTLEQATHWRNSSGKLCAVLFLVLFLSVMDGLVAIFRHPANLVELLPGEMEEISGNLRMETKDLNALVGESSSDQVRVSFVEIGRGFWLGGDMWRGKVSVDGGTPPGDVTVTIRQTGDPSGKPLTVYLVRVYRDAEAMRKESKSLVWRYGNLSPWLLMAVMVPLVFLGFLANYMLASRRDRLLAERGRAEIYHVLRGADGCQVSFGLGRSHGLEQGTRVTILDKLGAPACSVEVEQVFENDSKAMVPAECTVKIGYVVQL